MLVNINILAGISSTLFGLIYGIMTYLLPRATIGNPIEPMIFPMMISIFMFICGVVLIATESAKIRNSTDTAAKMELKFHGFKKMKFENQMILLTVVTALVYTIIFETVGYVLATILFLSVMLFAFNGKEKWKTNILVAVVFSIGIYIIFTKFLAIPLPMLPFLQI